MNQYQQQDSTPTSPPANMTAPPPMGYPTIGPDPDHSAVAPTTTTRDGGFWKSCLGFGRKMLLVVLLRRMTPLVDLSLFHVQCSGAAVVGAAARSTAWFDR
ncbi:hypothetical protein OROHE_019983 [Orobanche hederae]